MTKTILYFSPTGNVRYVAQSLADALHMGKDVPIAIEKTPYEKLGGNEHLIILFSIHGFNPPRTVKRFIKEMPEGLCDSISLLAVGCAEAWVNEAVNTDLRKFLESKGYQILIDRVLAMPLTLVSAFSLETGSELIVAMREKIDIIAEEIESLTVMKPKIRRRSKLIHTFGKVEDPASRLFGLELHTSDACIHCDLCIKECPEKNIHYNRKERPVFGLRCIMCLRCVYSCPVKAISPRIAKFIPIKGGYSLTRYLLASRR